MLHVFNPEHRGRLDSPERQKNLPPEQTLRKLGLKDGDVFIDIGCGTGYFSLSALGIVGEQGRVYAMDPSEVMLTHLREKAAGLSETPQNLIIAKSEPYNFPIPAAAGNTALLSNVLHEIEDKQIFLSEIHRVLAPGGKLLIIEWIKEITEGGPPLEERIGKEEMTGLLTEAGFQTGETGNLTPALLYFTAEKKQL